MSLPIALLLAAAPAGGGFATPTLSITSPTVAGQPLIYQLDGTTGIVGQPEFVFFSLGTLPGPVPINEGGFIGDILLGVGPGQFQPGLTQIVTDGSHLFGLPTPKEQFIVGLSLHAQGAGFVPAAGQFVLSTLATAVFDPPVPEDLSYSESSSLYIVGTEIADNIATVTWDVDTFTVDPSLPSGLSLDASTGIISGTPTAITPSAVYTVTATNVTGSTDVDITIAVDPAVPVSVEYTDDPVIYVVGIGIPPNNPIVDGFVESFDVSPALPDGLTLDTVTGVITGTPTTITPAADYTVTATNVTGEEFGIVNITVNPAAPIELSYSDPALLYAINQPMVPNVPTVTGVVDSFSIDPAPPAGINFNPINGVLDGTPAAISTYLEYTVTASNVTGSTQAQINFSVEGFATPQLTLTSGGQLGESLDYSLSGTTNANGIDEILILDFDITPGGVYLPFGLNWLAGTVGQQQFIGDGSHTWSIPGFASDPALLGMNVYAQAFGFVFSFPFGQSRLSQLVTTPITLPAPENLSYPVSDVLAIVGETIDPLVASVDNLVDSFSIMPALPAGLVIDTVTGTISGTPTAASAETIYTVTASNLAGMATYDLTITVLESLTPRFAYVPTDDGTIGVYTVDPNTGQLRHRGYELVGSNPSDVAVLPNGNAAFVANAGSDTISAFGGNAFTGNLNLLDTAVTGGSPSSVALDQDSAYLYAACPGTSSGIYAFQVGAGTLTPIPGSPFSGGTSPSDVVASPVSDVVLALGDFGGSPVLRSFAASANGSLGGVSTAFVGTDPSDVVITSSGDFAYVANRGDNTVSGFTVGSNGVVVELTGSPFGVAGGPSTLALSPNGDFLFVGKDDGNVSRFARATNGNLSSLGASVAAGGSITAMEVDASSSFLYVADGSGNEVLIYDISGTGGLSAATPLDGVRVRPGPSAIAMAAGIAPVSYSSTNVYVGNQNINQVHQYSASLVDGELSALTPPAAGAFDGPSSVTIHPDGALAAAAFLISNSIGAYFVNPITGAILPNLPATPVDPSPWSITSEPSGRFAYVTHSTLVGGGVQPMDWDLGESELIARPTVAGGNQTRKPAIDPAGRFLYAPNQADDTISQYAVDVATGDLSPIASAVSAGDAPLDIAVHPNGRFAYAPDFGLSNVTAYTIDAGTGELSFLGNIPMSGGNSQAIAIHPNGLFMYVANAATSDISRFSVNPQTGAATELGTVAAPAEARGLGFDASGSYLYVSVGGGVDGVTKYNVNTSTGALTEGGTDQAGNQPREVVANTRIE